MDSPVNFWHVLNIANMLLYGLCVKIEMDSKNNRNFQFSGYYDNIDYIIFEYIDTFRGPGNVF